MVAYEAEEPSVPAEAEAVQKTVEFLVEALVKANEKYTRYQDREFTNNWVLHGSSLWLLGDIVVVPDDSNLKLRLMAEHHDAPWAAHRGITKTVELFSRHFCWAKLRQDVTHYVRSCDMCQRM